MISYLKLNRTILYEGASFPLFVEFDYDADWANLKVSVKFPSDSSLNKIFKGNTLAYITFDYLSSEENMQIVSFRNYLSLYDKEWDKEIHSKIPKYMFQYGKGFGRLILCLGIQYIVDNTESKTGVLYLEAAEKGLIPYYESFGFKLLRHHSYAMEADLASIYSHCKVAKFYNKE